jgi:hypothetical protein
MSDEPLVDRVVGGLVTGLVPGEPGGDGDAIGALRRFQAERHVLLLRRLELRVALAHQRAQIAELEAESAVRLQGGVERVLFARAAHAEGALAIELREVNQRLLYIEHEISAAIGRAAAEVGWL